jgi:hypothetical protein
MPCAFHLDDYRRCIAGCQFAVPDNDLIRLDGKTWCRFHLPLRAGETLSEKSGWDRTDAFEKSILSYVDKAKESGDVADLSA